MLAVVTSKGQLTLPKGIREHLGLKAGSRLDFHVSAQGWLMARPVNNTALGLAGLLRRPGQQAMPLDAIDDAVLATAAELNAPAFKAHNKAPKVAKKPIARKKP